jgi:prolipoprotein diacylglyceryl transferase
MRFVWDVDPVFFTIPVVDLSIRYYGFIFAITFLLGFFLYRWQIKRGFGSETEAVSFILPGFLGVLLGARLGHVLFYSLDYVKEHPLWFFKVWEGGLSSHGAALGLVLALLYQAYRTKRPFWDLSDRFSFSAAVGAGLIRVANFINSEIVGKAAPDDAFLSVSFPRYDLPAGALPAPYRYPTQFLEALLGLFIFLCLYFTDRFAGKEKRPRGLLAAVFLILYFTGRFLIEFLKERQNAADNLLLSKGQMLSVIPLVFGVCLLIYVLLKRGSKLKAKRAKAEAKAKLINDARAKAEAKRAAKKAAKIASKTASGSLSPAEPKASKSRGPTPRPAGSGKKSGRGKRRRSGGKGGKR